MIKNEYRIDRALIRSWAHEYHLHGKANIISFILLLIIGLVSIPGLVLSIFLQQSWVNVYLFSCALVLSVYKLFFSRFVVWARRYRMMSGLYGVREWIRTTEFGEEDIVLTDHTSVTHLRYDRIEAIKERGNIVMIHFRDHLALRLYKDAFTVGSWQQCKQLLSEKRK